MMCFDQIFPAVLWFFYFSPLPVKNLIVTFVTEYLKNTHEIVQSLWFPSLPIFRGGHFHAGEAGRPRGPERKVA